MSKLLRPRDYKTFFMLNSAEHEFSLLIDMKMPTIVVIFIFISRENFMLGYILHEKMWLLVTLDLLAGQISCSAELSMKKVLITSGPGLSP